MMIKHSLLYKTFSRKQLLKLCLPNDLITCTLKMKRIESTKNYHYLGKTQHKKLGCNSKHLTFKIVSY